jgi:O-acetyl-ADP-ribose deacetylase (regulator of RNase III)
LASILINYMANDQPGYAVLIERILGRHFGPEAILRRTIQPNGQVDGNLPSEIDLIIAVVGSHWLIEVTGSASSNYMLNDLAEAFERHVQVIPVLTDNARIPEYSVLPDALRPLVDLRPRLSLCDDAIDSDVARIIDQITRLRPMLRNHLRPKRQLFSSETRRFSLDSTSDCQCSIGVITGDIAKVHDARIWVNGENTKMEMARVNDKSISAIVRFRGGEAIPRELTRRVGDSAPVPAGKCFVTGSGDLLKSNDVRYIIHVAAVEGRPGSGYQQVPDIFGCVDNVLIEAEKLAVQHAGVGSIIFPLLGTGEGGGDVDLTLRNMLDSVIGHLDRNRQTALTDIFFLAYYNVEYDCFIDYVYDNPRLREFDL